MQNGQPPVGPSWEELQRVIPWLWTILVGIGAVFWKIIDYLKSRKKDTEREIEMEVQKRLQQEKQKSQTDELSKLLHDYQLETMKRFDELKSMLEQNQSDVVALTIDYCGMVQMVKSLHKRVDKLDGQPTYVPEDYDKISNSIRKKTGKEADGENFQPR